MAFFAFLGLLAAKSVGKAQDLPAGTWRLSNYVVSGEPTPPPFAYLRIREDGSSEVCNGVEKLPSFVEFDGGKFRFHDPSLIAWGTDLFRSLSKTNGLYKGDEKTLILAEPSADQEDLSAGTFFSSEDNLSASYGVYILEKVGTPEELDHIVDQGDPALNNYLSLLVELNAGFGVDAEGKLSEISFANCSAKSIDIKLLETLPSLRTIALVESAHPVPISETIEFRLLDPSDLREWSEKNEAAGGKLIHEGRRERAALPLNPNPSMAPPVFLAKSDEAEESMAATLVSFRGKAFAFHHRSPTSETLPREMTHSALAAPVHLGRVVHSALGFVIREIAGNPGSEWLFKPLPTEASVIEGGQIWQIRLPDGGFYEGITDVGVANGIAPGGRIDWNIVKLVITSQVDGNLRALLGCPIVDARSGLLIGFVQNVYRDDIIEVEVNTFTDLTSFPEPRDSYDGVTFFDIPGRLSSEEVSSNLVGILRSEHASFPLQKQKTKEDLLKRPFFHYNNLMELPGREYLFSRIKFPNPAVISELHASSIQLPNHDARLRSFSKFLLAHLGEPSGVGGTFPDGEGRFGYRINLRWENEDFAVYYELSQQKVGNKVIAKLEVGKANAGRTPNLTQIAQNQTGGLRGTELVEQYFDWLDTLAPEMDFNAFDEAIDDISGTLRRNP